MTSSSCLLSDLNGAADAVLKVETVDTSPRSLLLPSHLSDIPSTEGTTPPDENGTYVCMYVCMYVCVLSMLDLPLCLDKFLKNRRLLTALDSII